MNEALDIEEITPEWLSAALGYRVRSFEREKIGTGQTGAAYRLTLDAERGPDTLLAKVATGDTEMRQRVAAGFACEVGFYAHLLDSLDVRTPACWYAGISDDRLRFTLLLEDLAPRTPGVQEEGCSLDRARAAVRNLAGLHAPRWNNPGLKSLAFLPDSTCGKRAAFLGSIAGPAGAGFVDRYRQALGPEDADTMASATAVVADWCLTSTTPFSILHGDYRLDNLMFGASADDVVALDWQTATVGPPARDLAYFIATSLDSETRRNAEEELVTEYHRAIRGRGVEEYSFEHCFRDYRLGQLQAPLITAIGCMYATGERSSSSDAMFLSMARRACAAIRDLGTLELI